MAKKQSTKQAPAPELAAPPPTAEGATGDATAAEGSIGPLVTLSSSLGAGLAHTAPVHDLGGLPPLASEPVIPPELDAELNNRERRIVWLMVNGANYSEALRNTARADGAQRSQDRTDAIPPAVLAAVAAIFQQVAARAGLNRAWLIAQTVALLERASSAVPVLDRKGVPTGEYRFDGPTAANCLKMLAEWNGELYPKKGGSLPLSDVAQLLSAVAGRGRPTLDARRLRLVGTSDASPQNAAAQQPAKAE